MNPNVTDLDALKQAAEAGDAAAQHLLGLLLLDGKRVRAAPLQGARWIEAAAAQGHAPALLLSAVFSTVGLHKGRDWREAVRLVARAAELGDDSARRQLALLGPPDAFDLAALPTPELRYLHKQPRIAVAEGFLDPAWCDWLIARAKPVLQQTQMFLTEGVAAEAARTNTGAGFSLYVSDVVIEVVNARIAALMGLPRGNQETINVLHYEPGQAFLEHYDLLDPKVPSAARELQISGQRVATVLVYLNEEYEGGETEFPLLDGWRFRGKKGDALVFWSLSAEGAVENNALHAGLPPTSGEKWLLSKWIRQGPVSLL